MSPGEAEILRLTEENRELRRHLADAARLTAFRSRTADPPGRVAEAAEYFRAAPERLACTGHGRVLCEALALARAQLSDVTTDLDQARSELNTERAMRSEGGP